MYRQCGRESRGAVCARGFHAFPYAVDIGCVKEEVLFLPRIHGVIMWRDKSREYRSGAGLGIQWGKTQANVVPVDHLVSEVTEEVAVCRRL